MSNHPEIQRQLEDYARAYGRKQVLDEIEDVLRFQEHWEKVGDLAASRYCAETVFTLQELLAHRFPEEDKAVVPADYETYAREARNADGRHPIG